MARAGNLPLRYRPIRRFSALFVGLAMYGTGMSLMIAAKLGLDPWDVFHQGVARRTGVSIGVVVIVVGVAVLLLWIPLRERPGVGTLTNAIMIGLVVNLVNAVLPIPHALWLRWTYAVAGVLATGVASGLYIGARLGAGPRDGLMTGVAARWPGRWFAQIRVVRTAIEVTVLVIGWLLGGTVGWVTLVFAVSIGPLAHVMIPLLSVTDPDLTVAREQPASDDPVGDPVPAAA